MHVLFCATPLEVARCVSAARNYCSTVALNLGFEWELPVCLMREAHMLAV